MKLALSTLLFMLCWLTSPDAKMTDNTINIHDISAYKGNLITILYNDAKSFPMKPDKSYKQKLVSVNDHIKTVEAPSKGRLKSAKKKFIQIKLKDIEDGIYAIAIIHDKNSNKRWIPIFWGSHPNQLLSQMAQKDHLGHHLLMMQN